MDEMIHKGHRQRMRRKLADYGPRVFDTYELLEMLLYRTVPVKDTNPLAKKLLMKFGSLDKVFLASKKELVTVDGIGDKTAELIVTVGRALEIAKDKIELSVPVPRSYDDFGKIVASYFAGREDYAILLISLDNSLNIIGFDEVYNIDYESAGVKASVFIERTAVRNASVVIIAHNHPFGPLYPTEGDRETNTLVDNALSGVGIEIAEHYIVSGMGYIGFMNHLDNAFAQKPALEKFIESKMRSIT